MATSLSVPRAGLRQWLGLAILALPTFLLAIDATVLYLAVPALAADIAPTGSQLLWIIDVYGFLIAGCLITMGSLGDRIGRRRLLLAGAALFGTASALAAYADDPVLLIVARALLGVAGATLMPSTLALISDMFPDARERGLAIGVWAACFSAGILGGPLIGGLLLTHFWWGSVFLIAVPVMALLLVAAPLLLPESRNPDAGRLAPADVLLSLAAILPVVHGLKSIAEHGPGPVALLSIAAGLTCGVLFVRRQRGQADPMVDLGLFRQRPFAAAMLALLAGLSAVGGIYLYLTQYLQLVAGLSPMTAALWLLPAAAALLVSSIGAPMLTRWIPPGVLVGASLGVAALGCLSLVRAGGDGSPAVVVTGLSIIYLGVGPLMALGTDLVVGAAPPERAGSAGALSETGMELGLGLGVAVLGSAGTAVYRGGLGGDVAPGVSEEALEAARDTLAAAATVAGELPAGQGEPLLAAAREAFTAALHVTGLAAGMVLAVAAVVTVLWARARPDR